MDLSDVFAELQDVPADDLKTALQEHRNDVYKDVYSDGFGAGKTEMKSDVQSAQETITQLKESRQELEDKVDSLQGEQPEVAELRGKYEQKLEEKQQQLKTARQQAEEVEREWRQNLRNERRTTFESKVADALKSKYNVDDDYADFKAQQATQSERVQFDDSNSIKLYESDGDTPTPLNGETAKHEAFAEDVAKTVPDKFVLDTRPGDTGMGSTNGRAGGPKKVSSEDLANGNVDPLDVLNGNVEVQD